MNWLNRLDFARFQRRTANAYENRLWQLLRNRQLWQAKFRRQHPLGMYTADFYCPDARLVVEIDGTEHFTHTGQKRDQVRDAWMQAQGIRVLRFTGKQVEFETQLVCKAIKETLAECAKAASLPQTMDRETGLSR